MITLFQLDDNQLPILTVEARTIKAFRDIIERDKSKTKQNAILELAFVYWEGVYGSPFHQHIHDSDEARWDEIGTTIGLKDYKPDDVVLAAIDKFKKLQHTKSMDLVVAAEKGIDKLREYLDSVDLTETVDSGPRKGALVHDTDKYMKVMSGIPNMVEALQKTKDLVKKEQELQKTGRGGRDIGMYED